MSQRKYLLFFLLGLVINFSALYIGSLFTQSGIASGWYDVLQKAPWTPDGWVFGVAWTTIGITFSAWYAWMRGYEYTKKQKLHFLFWISVVLNISWTPLFFHFHALLIAFMVLLLLASVVFIILLETYRMIGWKVAIWVVPYAIWLCIAISLNFYPLIISLL